MKLHDEVVKIANGIKDMRIRGAGRIARAAARAMMISAESYQGGGIDDFVRYMWDIATFILATRPTAVSLPNAVAFVMNPLEDVATKSRSIGEVKETVVRKAREFIEYSKNSIRMIGEIGARRIRDGDVVLTHCNSSAAIEVIMEAYRQGKRVTVYATETRPKFQGYLTTSKLRREGVGVVLVPDSAVRLIMDEVDKVVVGADTVAANGAVVNKVGTSQIALAAYEARVRLFVAAESYKFSPATVLGDEVVIEERAPVEVLDPDTLSRLRYCRVRNPAFDVTPAEHIDAVITEKGFIPPQAAILILKEIFGSQIERYHKLTSLTFTRAIEEAA